MRSLKRLITALLAFVMILTCVGIPTFAADFSDITDSKVAEAVDKLVGFNIITGYEDGTFRPDNQITRAEFAAIVTRYKGIADSLPADAVTGFADLDSDSSRAWARPYVKAAVDAKIINGFDDGTFRAGEPVTYEQAVKMLVCAAGYEVVAQSELNKIKITNPNATWSAGYIAAANKHGITKGVITAQITQPASRGVVAVLTSNTIDVPELKENEDGTFEKVEEGETDQTTKEIKGIVSGTYLTGLDAATVDLGQNEIMIGTGEDKQTYELTNELRDSLNFEDLIGKNVVAYYDKFDRQINKINQRNNTTTVIKEQDVISINGDTVKYYNENGKSESVSLSGYTKIYNGKYYPAADLENDFKNGQIELIEAGGQKIAKITSYQVFVVQSKTFNDNEERVYFKYNKLYNGNAYYDFPAATSSKPEVYVNGAKKEVAGSLFNEWTVINLLESPNVGGNKINRMYVTSGAKTGKITEGIDEERKVVMNDKEIYLTYDYSVNPHRVTNFELNNTYTYYLDYTGQIAAVNKSAATTSTNYEYGYITGADDEEIGLILKDGTHTVVTMRKNVKIDSVSTPRDEVKTKLGKIATLIGSSECYQPAKYYISGNELVALDTVANGYTDGEPSLATAVGTNSDDTFVHNDSANSVIAKADQVTIGGTLYNFSSTTKVIYVPDTKSSTSDYSVMSPSTAFAVGTNRKIEVFGADPEGRTKTATLVLMYGIDPAYDFTAKTPYMVVTRLISGGEKIEGYTETSPTTPTTIPVSEEKFKTPTGNENCVSVSAVDKGDIIRYIISGGDIVAIEMIYDASEGGWLSKAGDEISFATTVGSGELYIKYAEAFDMPEGENKLSVTQNMGTNFTDAEKQATGKFFKYSTSSSPTVYRISGGDVVAEKVLENISISAASPSEVIMITRSAASSSTPTAKVIYIVK